MIQEGTTFLYADENKKFYLNSFKKKECPQAKMISLLIDKDESAPKLANYIDHVTDCEDCLAKLEKVKIFTSKIDKLIPDPIISREDQVDFEIQLALLMKEVGVRAVKYQPSFWEKTKSLLSRKII
jgi:hypothetical protein